MLWRKVGLNDRYEYVAVVKMESIREDTALYGQRHFKVTLADNTTDEITFENDEWQAFACTPKKGGSILNHS